MMFAWVDDNGAFNNAISNLNINNSSYCPPIPLSLVWEVLQNWDINGSGEIGVVNPTSVWHNHG